MKKTEVPVCKEMKKLRKWLDDNKIPWLDASDCSKLGGQVSWWMCRTHFRIKDDEVSVINGYGSYGGITPYRGKGKNQGLLEIMCSWIPDVTGYLTADEVIKIMEEHMK